MNRHHCAGRNGRIAAALTAALFIGVLAFALTPESVSAESGHAWSWQELQEQLSTIKNGTVLLRADCIAAEGDTHLVVPEGSRISLNLNGYTIDASAIKVDVHGQTPGLEMGSGIVVGGSLSIWDSDADKKGTITGMRGSGAISVSGGTLSLYSGRITGNSGHIGAGGVNVSNGGKFKMSGGSIEGNDGSGAGGVVVSDGSFEMTKGTIAENFGTDAEEVLVEEGSFVMRGGEIRSDRFMGRAGPAVTIGKNLIGGASIEPSFEISGGSILGQCSTSGGVEIQKGTCSISENPVISNGYGADLYLAKGKRVNVKGVLDDAFSLSIETEEKPAEGEPVTITEGLKGRGNIASFISYEKYGVGENAAGEAVFGTPALDLSYEAGRGSGEDVTTKGIAEYTYELADCMFTPPTGMKFTGWLSPDGQTLYDPGDMIQLSSDIAFTAQYDCIEHNWQTKYEWAEGNTAVTATRICQVGGEKETETVDATSAVTTEPTCLKKGVRTFTSNPFTNSAFNVQEKTEPIALLEHDWAKPEYEWAEDKSTVTAMRVCRVGGEKETETVNATSEDTTEPTCEEAGLRTWTSEAFANGAFETQNTTEDIEPIGHAWGAWKVTKKANALTPGSKERICANDPSHMQKQTIPATGVSGTLLAKMTHSGSKSLKVTWTKIKGAEGYDIFFARCNAGGKEIACKKVKTVKGNKTFKLSKSGLKKQTAYKVYVKAYAAKNGKKTYIRTSPVMHAFTGGYDKKYTNAKAVTLKKTTVTLKKGRTYQVKAGVAKLKPKKKLMAKGHAAKLRYLSSNKKIAVVSKAGKITATAKGTCTIYVYAHNGICKSIKVTVK